MESILICDDNADIVEALKIYLGTAGYTLYTASNGAEALEMVHMHEIQLILMDIMMPQMDGLTATARLRAQGNIPIILLTAKSEETDMVLGLDMGADDYITKPFGMAELVARVKALLRRSGMKTSAERLVHDELTVDNAKHTVSVRDQNVILTYKEFSLLACLM